MRKLLLAASVAVMLVGSLPTAHGATSPSCNGSTTARVCNTTFSAALPGTVLTPYWGTDPLEDGTLGYGTCGTPFPDQSVDDLDFTIPANGTAADFNLVKFEIFPTTDYDSFICEIGDTENHNGIPNETLGQGANDVSNACDGVLGPDDPSGLGCSEKVSIPVTAGKKYRFRVYNWADAQPCPGKLTLTHVS
jgi:hypothetical protein